MTAGRPTSYDPKYCQMLIEHMSKGLSYDTFPPAIGVALSSIYLWEKNHPEFSEAKKEGTRAGMLFWEQAGINGMVGGIQNFNAACWIFNMKNRFKWRDRNEVVGDPDNPITIQQVPQVVFKVNNKELEESNQPLLETGNE